MPQNLDKRLKDGFPVIFKHGCSLIVAERARLEAVIEQAQGALSVMPSEEDIVRLLSLMFNVMKNGNASNDPEVVAVVYRMVVEGICYSVLEAAVKNIITGHAEGLSKIFFPTAAEFRCYCEKLEGIIRTVIKSAQTLQTRSNFCVNSGKMVIEYIGNHHFTPSMPCLGVKW